MKTPVANPWTLTAADIQALLVPGTACLPELDAARRDLQALRRAPQTQAMLAQTQEHVEGVESIPQTAYTHYRLFVRTGDRTNYETPYFRKRAQLSSLALRLFLGQTELKDVVQDYIWNICEETNWVLPAHELRRIDLFSAETGFLLAETLHVLGDALDAEIRSRVRNEIEQRVFDPYLRYAPLEWWYEGANNWNGVCNGSVACTFLLLESEPGRVAHALEMALAGLRTFLDTAFEPDGTSTEGVGYWQYGLMNFIALSEMLRARTDGAVDLLDSDHLRKVAAYPAKLLLSGDQFAPFSDCDETIHFNPGIITRFAERTGERSLLGLQLQAPRVARLSGDWRLQMMSRNILWWNGDPGGAGAPGSAGEIGDAHLPLGNIARFTAKTPAGAPVVLALKAGHNAENHNQNDVGSFIVHVDGETFLADPGRGLYNRQYFGPERYQNIFANSYGHGVPRIGGQMQKEGREFCGELLSVEMTPPLKRAEIEMARAYPVPNLASLRRQLSLDASGVAWLQDTFQFSANPVEVEEALATWLEVEANGATAVIRGERHTLTLTIEAPSGASFAVERLEEQCKANAKTGVLKRLTFVLPASAQATARVKIEVNQPKR